MIFLGGKEKTTLKDLTETLGKETIDMFNTSDTRATNVVTVSTIKGLEKNSCQWMSFLLWTAVSVSCSLEVFAPFLVINTTLQNTQNISIYPTLTRKNAFDIEKFLSTKLKLKANDVYEVYDMSKEEETTALKPSSGQ
mgnify:CR=1 FL=1